MINKSVTLLCCLFTTILLCSFSVFAQYDPPTGREMTLSREFEVGHATGQLNVWEQESGGVDSDHPSLWARNAWRCLSNSVPKNGQCQSGAPNVGNWGKLGRATVPVEFTERRSGMKFVINATSYHVEYVDEHAGGVEYQIDSAGYQEGADETWLYFYFPASELNRLPIGGVWQADIKLQLWQWDPKKYLNDWNAKITLKITDPAHIDIYFPEFRHASPLVELDLHPRGAPDQNAFAEDITTLDMCLYDGFNANSIQYELQIKDEEKPSSGRNMDDFSIYRDGGTTAIRDRIDYHVKLTNPETGALMDVHNSQHIIWQKVNVSLIRPVRIPAISYPVLCVPAPLQLIVDKFDIKDKNAGHYQGKLTVVFTPTTVSAD